MPEASHEPTVLKKRKGIEVELGELTHLCGLEIIKMTTTDDSGRLRSASLARVSHISSQVLLKVFTAIRSRRSFALLEFPGLDVSSTEPAAYAEALSHIRADEDEYWSAVISKSVQQNYLLLRCKGGFDDPDISVDVFGRPNDVKLLHSVAQRMQSQNRGP